MLTLLDVDGIVGCVNVSVINRNPLFWGKSVEMKMSLFYCSWHVE